MKYSLVLVALLTTATLWANEEQAPTQMVPTPTETTINISCPDNSCQKETSKEVLKEAPKEKVIPKKAEPKIDVLEEDKSLLITVTGQGVAPMNTSSPAQAYALAKRAAVADAYRLIAEKVKGVRIDGQDLIKNMMVKRSTVRTSVQAMVRNANIVETTFKEGLCEVEMEIKISHSQFQ